LAHAELDIFVVVVVVVVVFVFVCLFVLTASVPLCNYVNILRVLLIEMTPLSYL
jgi:hypothetical protein